MTCLSGMDKLGGRARGRQRGGDLLSDMAALAHAGDDNAPVAAKHEFDGALEVRRKPIRKRCLQRLQPVDGAA